MFNNPYVVKVFDAHYFPMSTMISCSFGVHFSCFITSSFHKMKIVMLYAMIGNAEILLTKTLIDVVIAGAWGDCIDINFGSLSAAGV